MAKNTASAQFRKINVDDYNEDNYVDDEVSSGSDLQGPNESEITSLLNGGKKVDALKSVLNNAPVSSKNQATKDKALQLTLQVLQSFKAAEIEDAVKSLDQSGVDTLMKYIYRGFEVPSEGSSALLLTWFEKVFAVGSYGSIVRVLTDKKRV